MTRRRCLALAVLAAAAAALPACERAQTRLARPASARRVVSLSPATTEALFAVGSGERVVGRSRFCDWPPEALRLPVVGGFVDANLELILELAPDLVVGAPSPASTQLERTLQSRGIVTWFPQVDSLLAIDAMIVGMGERTAHAREAERVVATVDDRVRIVEMGVARLDPPRVLFVLSTSPVVAAGPHTFVDELITRARATNCLTSGGAWQTLGLERIVEVNPDVVIDATVLPGDPSRIDPQGPGWSAMRAVQTHRVVPLGDSRILRPGPRVAEGLALLARAIHPEARISPP